MLYNDEYSFKIENNDILKYIWTSRNSNDEKSDFSTLDLYKKVQDEFKLKSNTFILNLNEKEIPADESFSIFSLQYLPYQRIKIENKPSQLKENRISSRTDELIIKWEFSWDKNNEREIKYNVTEFNNIQNLTIFDVKMKLSQKFPEINPYELIFTTQKRYVGEDENPFIFLGMPLIATRRSKNDALYPLFFQLPNEETNKQNFIKKWYNQNTTFGQIAFDIFGENYYKYKFESIDRNNPKTSGKRFFFTTIVDEIKIGRDKILNYFQIKENNELYYTFSCKYNKRDYYLNSEMYNGRIKATNPSNEDESTQIYNIQQKINSNIKSIIQCDAYFIDQFNLKAKIEEYGSPFEYKFSCKQPSSSNTYRVYFYVEQEFRNVYLPYCSTVFNLRYYISVIKEVNIENVVIFKTNVDNFKKQIKEQNLKGLDDDLIIKQSYLEYNYYIAYIVYEKIESDAEENTYISPKIALNNDNVDIELTNIQSNSLESSQSNNISTSFSYPISQLSKKHHLHNDANDNQLIINTNESEKHDEIELLNDKINLFIQRQKEDAEFRQEIKHSGTSPVPITHLNNQRSESNEKRNVLKKANPVSEKIESNLPQNNETNIEKEQNKRLYLEKEQIPENHQIKSEKIEQINNKNISQASILDEKRKKTKYTDTQTEKNRKKETKEDTNPTYLELKFKYKSRSQELVILHLPNDETLSTLESKICRFYKIDTKIDFFFENDFKKNPINNLAFSKIKEPIQPIIINSIDKQLEKKIYYRIYGGDKEYKIDNIKTVEQLKNHICGNHKKMPFNQIKVIFGGKILNDDMDITRLSSTEENKNVLIIYQDKSIDDFSGTVDFNKKLIPKK